MSQATCSLIVLVISINLQLYLLPISHHCIVTPLYSFQSIWQSFPSQKNNRKGPGKTVCHESLEEGLHHSENQDDRTHQDREAGPRGHKAGPIPSPPPLCLPDRGQIAPHPR